MDIADENDIKSFDLDDAFESVMRTAWPTVPEASGQYWDSRRIFFAAAECLYAHMLSITLLSDEEAEKQLQRVRQQLEDFGIRLKEGKV